MQLSVNGLDTFVATGGRQFDVSQATIVLLHGAGFDHTTWALHSRWFAHHGYGVLAPDLPGHGRSIGPPLPTIADMADWTAALLDAAGAAKARLVGHSMGSLIALETAARHPAKVSALSLIGTAATMTVGPDLLKAAEANDPTAIDMVSIWGLGFQAELGGSLAPGLWTSVSPKSSAMASSSSRASSMVLTTRAITVRSSRRCNTVCSRVVLPAPISPVTTMNPARLSMPYRIESSASL